MNSKGEAGSDVLQSRDDHNEQHLPRDAGKPQITLH